MRKIWHFIREPLWVFLGVFLFHSFAFAQYEIWPSESMVPTLEVGDRVLVNKYTYGYSRHSMPFGLLDFEGRVWQDEPRHGDIVVFADPKDDSRTLIKRIIGLGGDEVQMIGGRLHVNGKKLRRDFTREYGYEDPHGTPVHVREYREFDQFGKSYSIAERTDYGRLDNTDVYTVPEGHFFAMGDNRDNSADSRVLSAVGYVPLENIIGRADVIGLSLYGCDDGKDIQCHFGIPFSRFFTKLM